MDRLDATDSALRDVAIDDPTLAAGLVAREPWAQRIAWHRLSPMVRRMCTRAFPQGDVDDLVQEVFFVLFRRVHTLRDPRALRAFVMAIANHEIRAALRRKVSAQGSFLSKPPAPSTASADLEARQALDHLGRLLRRLNALDRHAFALRFIEGYDLEAVALALDASVTTAKRRIARAWKRVIFHAQRDGALVGYIVDGAR